MFRLKQKHTRKPSEKLPPADGPRLLAEQSVLRGALGSIAVALLLSWFWALLSLDSGLVFPWFSVLIGALIGVAVQRFGRGLDWRFPVIAVLVAGLAAYVGNLLIGVLQTAQYIDATPGQILGGLSLDTLRVFFDNNISPTDHIYAFSSCGVAAFFANRRLKRHEVLGLRLAEKERSTV
jgi:hypothetical protein